MATILNMNTYQQARSNLDYWLQWAQNRNNVALQLCTVCEDQQSCPPVHLREQRLCLDCHGELREVLAFVYVCKVCSVIHGWSGGNSSPYARYHRSGLLIVKRGNIERDLTSSAVLSDNPEFQEWLTRRARSS